MPAITVNLPDWLTQEGATRYVVDPDKAYPAILLGLRKWIDAEVLKRAKPRKGKPTPFTAPADLDPAKPTQYWLEVAYLLLKEMVAKVAPGHVSRLRILRRENWSLLAHPAQDSHTLAVGNDPAMAKLQREVSCHQARKEIGHYLPAVPALLRG